MLIDAKSKEVQLGAIEGSVIADPAAHLRVYLPGETGQVLGGAAPEMPRPDRMADRLSCRRREGWSEAHEAASRSSSQTSSEGVAQEVEAGMLGVSWAVRVLAVHDLRLLGTHVKTQGLESLGDRNPQASGLHLSVT